MPNPLFLIAVVLFSAPLSAQFLHFDADTDTVDLGAFNTVIAAEMTLEARVMLCGANPTGLGWVWIEQIDALEDKALAIGPSAIAGAGFQVGITNASTVLRAQTPVSPAAWHHVAYVISGGMNFLYLDGVLVTSSPRNGASVSNNGASRMALGAFHGSFGAILQPYRPGFIGFIDWVRISNVARFSGFSFPPPAGAQVPEPGTLLLFEFDDPVGSITITDLVSQHVGILGAGLSTFGTSPQIVATACGVPTNPFPGTNDSIELRTGIGLGQPNGIGLKHITPGQQLRVELTSVHPAIAAGIPLLAFQLFPSAANPISILSGVYLNPFDPGFAFVVDGTSLLNFPPGGIGFSVAMPPLPMGSSVLLQGYSLTPLAINQLLAASNAHEIRVQ